MDYVQNMLSWNLRFVSVTGANERQKTNANKLSSGSSVICNGEIATHTSFKSVFKLAVVRNKRCRTPCVYRWPMCPRIAETENAL